MRFAFNEEQQELRRHARSFLHTHCSSENIRQVMQSREGYDLEVWQRITGELGWPAMLVPEPYGGIGLSYVDLVALLEETGAALLCAPLFSTVALGLNALLVGGSEEQRTAYLPRIASGELTATVAYTETNGRWDARGIECLARRDGTDYILEGCKTFVPDGYTAGLLVVAARHEGSTGEEGVSLFAVPSDTAGIVRTPLPTMDQTRKQAEIRFDRTRLPTGALMGEEGAGWPALSKVLDLAAIALAAEQVGGAQRCLDMSVTYAKERTQFGRPIGSFQAIKHKCADMLVLVESARSASYYAAWAASQNDPELPALASLAKAYCSDAYFKCAAEAIQIHGGVGFTWEYDLHLYFKRAKSTETFLGDASYHRELVAKRLGW